MASVRMNELWEMERKAVDKYLALRDAKSNGCCYGFTIPQVLAYDNKIMAAKAELDAVREEIRKEREGQ